MYLPPPAVALAAGHAALVRLAPQRAKVGFCRPSGRSAFRITTPATSTPTLSPTLRARVGRMGKRTLQERMSRAMDTPVSTHEPMTPATLAPSPHPHAVRSAALHHAVRRDLRRLETVLDEPVTAVRRQAI